MAKLVTLVFWMQAALLSASELPFFTCPAVPREGWLIVIIMFLRKHFRFCRVGRMLSKRQHQAGLAVTAETIRKHHLALQLSLSGENLRSFAGCKACSLTSV